MKTARWLQAAALTTLATAPLSAVPKGELKAELEQPKLACADLKSALAAKLKGEGYTLDASELRGQPIVISASESTSRQELILKDLPPLCRVVGTLRPRPDAAIGFELWLPERWNGRYLQLGNGGFAGTIHHGTLATYIKLGYAVAGTDGGHKAYDDDTRWAIGEPEKIKDFGFRAVHETSLFAQNVLPVYYQKPVRYRYFSGCSDGGREALMEAQRYPDDFDGYLAGAPALRWTHGFSALLSVRQILASIKDEPIRLPQLKALSQEALRQCDTKDGVRDGVIDPIAGCTVNLKALLCAASGTSKDKEGCMSAAQLKAVAGIYSGALDEKSAVKNLSGFAYTLGFEDGPFQWQTWFTGPTMWGTPDPLLKPLTDAFFGPLLYQKLTVNVEALPLAEAVAKADRDLAPWTNATDPDLKGIRLSPKKKILQYHGWADAAVPAQYSIDYYQAVHALKTSDSTRPVDDYYRLFMVPGMGHCFSGSGPNVFNGSDNQGGPRDAEHDVQLALERWVEEGVAPERIIASQFIKDDVSKGVLATRPLCPYPQRARWNGKGPTSDAAYFTCQR